MMGFLLEEKIYFVVVIYNKRCLNSPSIDFAIHHKKELEIVVIDNSTADYGNKDFCTNNSVTYISMQGNAGLSRAYNRAISHIGKNNGYVIWADDDTTFPDNYICDMLANIKREDYDIALPLVLTDNDIYSPITFDENGIPKRISDISELKNRITGINSGMMVNLRVYQYYRYDEEMFLDFVDHDLCASCGEQGGNIGFVEQVVLRQNSFFASEIRLGSTIKRRSIYRKDFRLFCRRHGISRKVTEEKILHGEISIIVRYIKQLMRLSRDYK